MLHVIGRFQAFSPKACYQKVKMTKPEDPPAGMTMKGTVPQCTPSWSKATPAGKIQKLKCSMQEEVMK